MNEASAEYDVLIVGAGLAGIGMAVHLQRECPEHRFALLESRAALGGTWDQFRYPGIRSDSDMHTLGYDFKPWRNPKAIADGPAILAYLQETAQEYGIDRRVAFGRRVTEANWDSGRRRWELQVEVNSDGQRLVERWACRFLLLCTGYFRYDGCHRPEFSEEAQFTGPIIDPMHWPPGLPLQDRRIVVIGSGATAITLVPSLAAAGAQVTMLQRSPTWVVSWPEEDWLANLLRRLLPDTWAYRLTRSKNTRLQQMLYRLTRTRPNWVRKALLWRARRRLRGHVDVDRHFTPRYQPWDQRICLIPDNDLFNVLISGKAQVVTGEISRFTSQGIELASGERLEADVIVAATGLELQLNGGMSCSIDGTPINFANTWSYRGCMYSGVPNLVSFFGYINSSWTLRTDLIARYVCRLLEHQQQHGWQVATPVVPGSDSTGPQRAWIDDFTPGYILRAMARFPRQGSKWPWINPQNYRRDRSLFLHEPLEDGVLELR